ncbi:MAG TPA: hypothetical protein VLA46_06385 [Saprospiraceae bacterium]|nr:hypothetical protein [Saprospiraceae bacterium]
MRFLYVLWSGYLLYLVYSVYAYFKGKHLVSSMEIYNNFFIKKIALVLVVLAVSYALKHFGKITLAKWVAGVPLIVLAVPMIGAAIGMFMYWFSMYISQK